MREPLPTDQIDAASTASDPLAEAIRKADLAALWQAIEALPLQQRDALLLREFGGLSYDELAVALAVSGPAVESLLFRARQRLRAQLRTAYASLTGASWLEALARVFAGGSAPVAAKVAALGVGAAAVSSGAVVAPRMLENHNPLAPAREHTAPQRHRVPQVVPVRSAAVVPAPATPAPTVAAEPAQADDRSVEDRRGRIESPAMTTTGAAAELSSSGSGEDGGGSDSGSGGDGSPSSGGDGDVHDNGG